jgi:hypothetical protein
MNEDNWPDSAPGTASGDDQHVVGVAQVPGLHAILNESTASELPLIQPAHAQPAEPRGPQPR